jgi:nucleotide-binding universal stress UspA family protein
MSISTFLQRATDSITFAGGGKQWLSRRAGIALTMTEPAALASEPGGRRAGTKRRARRGARPGHRIRSAGSGSAEHRRPILAGYDGSNSSRHALAYAAGMARRLDGWLVVVHVWRGDGFVFVPPAERMRWLRTELTGADLTGLDIEIIVRYGRPARELRRVTVERGADAIVIGAPERFPHRFAGSVSAWLARHAECPAVIVP